MQVLKPEKKIEEEVCIYAAERGVMLLKLNVIGRKGWPDRLFAYNGRVMFIEFKRADEEPTKLQRHIHGKLRGNGFDVHVVRDTAYGKRCIDQFTKDSSDF